MRIVCPNCQFSKDMPEGAVPPGRRTIGCPRCKTRFEFDAAPARAEETGPPPAAGQTRSRRLRRLAVLLALLAVIGGSVATAGSLFRWKPIVAEKLWLLGLVSGIAPVQQISIRALREHPTRNGAVALVMFINLKNLHRVPDPKKPESPEDKAKRLAKRAVDLKLAEQATETLCLLTGHSFGTYFRKERSGHSWGSLDERLWPRVLGEINVWALKALGELPIPAL